MGFTNANALPADVIEIKPIHPFAKHIFAIGLILIDDLGKAVASPFGGFPVTTISSDEGGEILSYINSTRYKTCQSMLSGLFLVALNLNLN